LNANALLSSLTALLSHSRKKSAKNEPINNVVVQLANAAAIKFSRKATKYVCDEVSKLNNRAEAPGDETDATAEETDHSSVEEDKSFGGYNSPEESPGELFGAIGYKFKRQLYTDGGESLGWFEGQVVNILPGGFRKVLYYENGFIEELGYDDLEALAETQAREFSLAQTILSMSQLQ